MFDFPAMPDRDFPDMTDDEVRAFLQVNTFTHARKLDDGSWIGIMRLITTHSVCMDITVHTPFRYRWCFKDFSEAMQFFLTAEDFDEIPDVRTSLVGHRYRDKPLLEELDAYGYPRW